MLSQPSFALIHLLWSLPFLASTVQSTDPVQPGKDVTVMYVGSAGGRLHEDLMNRYNRYVLPVFRTDGTVNIRLLLKLVQIVDIDEKNQVLTTNVWLRHEWYDSALTWNPLEYGNITKMNLPAEDIWLPDTVLYNNAEGDYQITIKTKVTVFNDGRVIWDPPAIYKSFCAIDVKYFPFDEQVCDLKFGPWSFDSSKVDYWLFDVNDPNQNLTNHLDQAVDMAYYYMSVEWDVLQVTGHRTVFQYPCCVEKYVDITYRIHIRRKTLFYTVNLIIPCVSISFLTIFVFYLPSASGEKITLSISILVSLTVFILLLYEIIPPTSLALPLMSRYLLFTMVIVTLSIIITTMILNTHFCHSHASHMPQWVRKIFLQVLPRLLLSSAPETLAAQSSSSASASPDDGSSYADIDGANPRHVEPRAMPLLSWSAALNIPPPQRGPSAPTSFRVGPRSPHIDGPPPAYHNYHQYANMQVEASVYENLLGQSIADVVTAFEPYFESEIVRQAVQDVQLISEKFRETADEVKTKADWEAVARVCDRFFLFVFSATCIIGTCAILLSAPSLYDTTPAIG